VNLDPGFFTFLDAGGGTSQRNIQSTLRSLPSNRLLRIRQIRRWRCPGDEECTLYPWTQHDQRQGRLEAPKTVVQKLNLKNIFE
jgi:hypothetical protein